MTESWQVIPLASEHDRLNHVNGYTRLSSDRWKLDTHDAKSKRAPLQFPSLGLRIYRLGVDYVR